MAHQWSTIGEKDFSQGIDKASAENQIKPGFIEDAVNIDTTKPGTLAKRKGYQTFGGNVPFRVLSYREDADTDQVCFTLDGSVNLSTLRNQPIIVAGKSSVTTNQFSTEQARYYAETTSDIRTSFPQGPNTATLLGATHGQQTEFLFVGTAQSSNPSNNSNSQFISDGVRINKSTYDVNIDYTNSTGQDFTGFIFAKSKTATPGLTYVTPAPVTIAATSTQVINITQATHSLANNNLGIRVYIDAGTEYQEVLPDQVTIQANGDVAITVTNGDTSSVDVIAILTITPDVNVLNGTVADGATETIVITGLTSAFLFVYPYLENVSTEVQEAVIPESVIVDEIAGTATVSFTNNTGESANFYVYYEEADVLVNEICVQLSTDITTTVDDTRPQLTLWGLDHETLYNQNADDRPGWVQHIDAYKSTGERYLVCGLGGNLYSYRTLEEVGSSYLLPTLYPRLINRVNTNQRIGPAFSGYTVGHLRTRGTIQFTGGDDYLATCETITWQSGNTVRYTLNVPNLTVNGTLSEIITVNQDYLTVTESGYSRNEGTFLITNVVNPGGDILYVDITNPRVSSSDWNETNSGAQCGVYTDSLTFLNPTIYLPGDQLISGAFGESLDIRVLNSRTDAGPEYVTTLGNVTTPLNVPAGQRVIAERTNCVIPLRNANNAATVANIVPGDMLSFTGIDRLFRVKHVITRSNVDVNVVGNVITGEATVTLGSGDTTTLQEGQRISLVRAGAFSGTFTIVDVTDLTTFTISTSIAGSESGVLLGNCVCIDEVLTYRDSSTNANTFSVPSRWIPVEAPAISGNDLVPSTEVTHFDSNTYSGQPTLRSTMVQDSMFFTNGSDEVTKYDGVDLYRAGLPRWQPQLFTIIDEVNDTIVVRSDTIAVDATTGSRRVAVTLPAEAERFTAGDLVYHDETDQIYVVERVLGGTTGELLMDRLVDTAVAGNLSFVNRYRYYFRLNAVDKNQNIIVSATTGASDNVVNLTKSSSVKLRLVGFPAWDIYDYDKLELEIYRTKANTVGPFYRVATLPLSFNTTDGYVDYVDTASDDELIDLDGAITALKGQELAPALSLPWRGKYITSSGNRLILANVTEYPKIDINIEGVSTATNNANLDGKRWLFRKTYIDTATDTNMLDRAAYEWTLTSSSLNGAPAFVAGTSITFTATLIHNLSVGDWVYLFRSSSWDNLQEPNTVGMGWYQVSAVPSATEFTVDDANAPASVSGETVDSYAVASTKTDIPVYIGVDYNYDVENGNTRASDRQRAMRRLANAINTSMRVTNRNISGQETFEPWMIANAGSEYGAGQIVVEQPKVFNTFLEVVIPTPISFSVFVNNFTVAAGSQQQAIESVFPSRIIASYPNYPEVFDAPGALVDAESDSAVDVNSADGQQITGVIPFFGESAFGSAQKDAVIVVFKTNSIYLVNLEAKRQGFSAVQKIDSQGLGCTYPYSIASTREGIMFANEAGVYRLSRNMTINYVGRMLERYWEEDVDKDQLELAQGHNYALGRTYKLSYPLTGETANSTVLVYDHTQEYQSQQGLGAWSIFTNHPVTGWANLDDSAYFASTKGRVFSLRQAGDETDYRDDNQAIEATITFRALDFGDAAIRKYVSNILLHLRSPVDADGSKFYVSTDLNNNFDELDQFKIQVEDTTTGISDVGLSKIVTLKFNTSRSKFTYLQNRLTNSNIDESMEVTGIEYRVTGLSSKGLTDAARTNK